MIPSCGIIMNNGGNPLMLSLWNLAPIPSPNVLDIFIPYAVAIDPPLNRLFPIIFVWTAQPPFCVINWPLIFNLARPLIEYLFSIEIPTALESINARLLKLWALENGSEFEDLYCNTLEGCRTCSQLDWQKVFIGNIIHKIHILML